MAKRMTDTDKWKKPFLKTLPVEYKVFWLYLLDECDHAGVWHVELDLAEMRLGIKLSPQKIRGFFKERIVEFDNGAKWFLPDFISFQYGELDERNRAHKSVIDRLIKYNLHVKKKGVVSPLQGAKDKDKAKDIDKDKENGQDESLTWNVELFITERQSDFNQVCMATYKTPAQATASLTKYHLWLEREGKYPLQKKSALAGFKLWLLNERDAPASQDNRYEDELTKARQAFKPTPQ